jgi:hypothetical protein
MQSWRAIRVDREDRGAPLRWMPVCTESRRLEQVQVARMQFLLHPTRPT